MKRIIAGYVMIITGIAVIVAVGHIAVISGIRHLLAAEILPGIAQLVSSSFITYLVAIGLFYPGVARTGGIELS